MSRTLRGFKEYHSSINEFAKYNKEYEFAQCGEYINYYVSIGFKPIGDGVVAKKLSKREKFKRELKHDGSNKHYYYRRKKYYRHMKERKLKAINKHELVNCLKNENYEPMFFRRLRYDFMAF